MADNQDGDQEILELPQENQPGGNLPRRHQDVGAVKAEALPGFVVAQALEPGSQQFQNLHGAQGVHRSGFCFHSRYFIP